MRKWVVSLAAMLLLTFGAAQAADNAAANQNMQIGVVDVAQVLQKAPQVATLRQQLKDKYAAREKDLVAAQKQLQADIEKLNRDGSVMAAADKTKLQEKIQAEQNSLRSKQVSFQQDLYNDQSKQMQDLLNRMQGVVGKIAKQQNLNLVLLKGAVAYAANETDITDQVIKELK